MRHKTQDPQRADGWPLCPKCGSDTVTIPDERFKALAAAHVNECPPMLELRALTWFCKTCAVVVNP